MQRFTGESGLFWEPVSWDNIDGLLAGSAASSTQGYELPTTTVDALKKLALLDEIRRQGMGDEFLAYADSTDRLLVGGGEVMCLFGRLTLGYWVVADFRGQGIGNRIAGDLESYAAETYPNKPYIEAHIHPKNVGSLALAGSRDYKFTGQHNKKQEQIYRKRLRA